MQSSIYPAPAPYKAAPVFWLTGLSGSGKSTLAEGVSDRLISSGITCVVIDGDVLRSGLSSDLGFSSEDRAESVRRAACVAAICANAGIVTFVSLVSPFETDRIKARHAIGPTFREIFVNADFSTCQGRDVKGLYRLAAAGKLPNFTGLDSPYERPSHPDLTIDTMTHDIASCIDMIVQFARAHGADSGNRSSDVTESARQGA
jgi:adenylyl-sulfate kinase